MRSRSRLSGQPECTDLCRRQYHAFKGATAEALKDPPAGPEQAIIPPIIGQRRDQSCAGRKIVAQFTRQGLGRTRDVLQHQIGQNDVERLDVESHVVRAMELHPAATGTSLHSRAFNAAWGDIKPYAYCPRKSGGHIQQLRSSTAAQIEYSHVLIHCDQRLENGQQKRTAFTRSGEGMLAKVNSGHDASLARSRPSTRAGVLKVNRTSSARKSRKRW